MTLNLVSKVKIVCLNEMLNSNRGLLFHLILSEKKSQAAVSYFHLNSCEKYQCLSQIIVLYFTEFELQIHNRYSSFINSLMIKDHVSICFLLFLFAKCLRGWTFNVFYFRFFAEDKRAGSNPMQTWSLWPLMSSR